MLFVATGIVSVLNALSIRASEARWRTRKKPDVAEVRTGPASDQGTGGDNPGGVLRDTKRGISMPPESYKREKNRVPVA